MTRKEQKIYKTLIKTLQKFLREDYPDLRKMPKDAKLRYKSVKELYKDIAKSRAGLGSLPIEEYGEAR